MEQAAATTYTVPALIAGHKPSAKKPSVAEQLLAWHKENATGGEFGIIVKNAGLLRQIIAYENERRTARQTKGHPHKRIFDIEPLPGLVHHMRLEPKRVKAGRNWRLQYSQMQGTFMVRVTESLPIFIVSWGPSPKQMAEMAIGSQKAFDVLYERLETKRRRLVVSAPPKGIWDIQRTDVAGERVTHFTRKKFDVENTLRFCGHPMYTALEEDLQAFFGNIGWWTRYNQPGMRKVLLTGPPGTGKTSIAMALAARHHEKLLVLYAQSSEDVIEGAELAAAKKRPTIIIAEEVDMLKRPDGFVLNWLDGSETPRNPAGTYVITTTNYPRKIDPRILKRPGRIDRAFRVGALRTKDCAQVALSYLGDDGRDMDVKALGRALDRTTPAEIREIVGLAIRSLQPGEALTIEAMEIARSGLKRSLAEVENYGDDDPEGREELHQRMGPIDTIDEDEQDG